MATYRRDAHGVPPQASGLIGIWRGEPDAEGQFFELLHHGLPEPVILESVFRDLGSIVSNSPTL